LHRTSQQLERLVAIAAMGALALTARAQDAPISTEPAGPGAGAALWELGLGALAGWQPAYPGADEHLRKLRLLPYGIYRGDVVRVEDGAVGLRAVRTPRTEWGVSGAFSFGGGADQVKARSGMPSIGTLVEAGPQLRVNLGPLDEGADAARRTRLFLPLRMVFDMNDRFSRQGWSFEPRLGHTLWQGGDASLSTSAGLLFGDRRLNSLFYGVAPAYATPERPAYTARGGLIALRLGTTWAQRLTPAVRVYAFAGLESVQGAANGASPLVRRRQDLSLGIGATWSLWRSDGPARE